MYDVGYQIIQVYALSINGLLSNLQVITPKCKTYRSNLVQLAQIQLYCKTRIKFTVPN